MYPEITDEALMKLIKQSNQAALETLFNRYYAALCRFCGIYTKDDAVAEELIANLFMRLWDGKENITILNIKNYLFVSAKNMALNHLQKKKDPVDYLEDFNALSHHFQERDNPFKILSGRESCTQIMQLIAVLPASQREVLLMSRVENLDKSEISALLNISVRTVETTLYQAIKRLRTTMKDHLMLLLTLHIFLI